jgi:hypothetical protein
MNRRLLIGLIAAALLHAKGVTVKIAIEGASLAKPVEITGEAVGAFHIWSGPGVFVNGVEQKEGFIIDWSKGILTQRPTGLREVEVRFYASHAHDGKPSLAYVVTYAFDPATGQGFVYLPGRNDEAFKVNTAMFHGPAYEGNWFRATAAWERFAQPLLAGAK